MPSQVCKVQVGRLTVYGPDDTKAVIITDGMKHTVDFMGDCAAVMSEPAETTQPVGEVRNCRACGFPENDHAPTDHKFVTLEDDIERMKKK